MGPELPGRDSNPNYQSQNLACCQLHHPATVQAGQYRRHSRTGRSVALPPEVGGRYIAGWGASRWAGGARTADPTPEGPLDARSREWLRSAPRRRPRARPGARSSADTRGQPAAVRAHDRGPARDLVALAGAVDRDEPDRVARARRAARAR